MTSVSEQGHTGVVRPWPLADWRQIVGAAHPAAEATQQRLRTLRSRSVLSDGIQEAVKSRGSLEGKVSLFCELNVDAAVLSRKGLDEQAARYREAASDLEKQLVGMLADHHVRAAELLRTTAPRRSAATRVLSAFSDACARARKELAPVPDEDVVTGILAERSGDWVHFSCVNRGRDFDIPWTMALRAGLSIGDPAVVTRELLPNGNAVVRLQPGLRSSVQEEAEDDTRESSQLEAVARRPLRSSERRQRLLAELASEEPLARRDPR